jgi:hypothetical protein
MWNDRRTSDQGEDEEEDMRKRENELKQELNMATLRCEELKRTMIETKSFIDPLHSGEQIPSHTEHETLQIRQPWTPCESI